jgi:5-methyltetrahydrofolate--homocysteine methyltransferase
MLKKIQKEKLLTCRGVVGLWGAVRQGDDINVLDDAGNKLATLYGLRQQVCCILSP